MTRASVNRPADLLQGSTALIAGGTGNVGRVVVREFLDAGATVVVPSRSAERLSALCERLGSSPDGSLVTVVGDLSDEEDGSRVRREVLDRVGPLDAAVATLGALVPAPSVLEAPLRDMKRVLDGYLLAHFMVAKAMLPAVEERSGSYTFINGPLAFEPLFPGTGLVSIATAAQAMLAQTIIKEEARRKARLNELVIYTRFGVEDGGEGDGPVSQRDVARYLAYLASPRGASLRGERIHLNTPEPLLTIAHGD